MTKEVLTAYAKLAALAVLLSAPLVRWILRPFARRLWPTSPKAEIAVRRMVAGRLAEVFAPETIGPIR